MENKKRIAVYIRISTIDKGQTLEQQEKPLIDYCNNNNYDYVIFKEYASGSKESRPELDKMMIRSRQKEFNGVLIFRLDRLGRSLKHLLQLIEEFRNNKIRFICLTQNIDTDTPQGMLLLHILGSIAEFERQLIRERTKEKLEYLKSRGVKLGRPSGSKDKKLRRKSGYFLRWSKTK